MDNSPFYAYITCADPSSATLTLPRSVMVFSNGSIADEWWRFVSAAPTSDMDPHSPTRFSSYLAYILDDKDFTITRTSPQLYMCKSKSSHGHGLIDRIFRLKPICEKFEGKLFVGPEGMTSSLVPSRILTEHISGNWYHIRAKHDRNIYWIYNYPREISITMWKELSKPTAFKIVGIDVPEGTVLIGSDKIKILLGGGPTFLSYEDLYNGGKQLVVTQKGEPAEFLFSALGNGTISGLKYGGINWELNHFSNFVPPR